MPVWSLWVAEHPELLNREGLRARAPRDRLPRPGGRRKKRGR